MMDDLSAKTAAALHAAHRIIILTGAGASAESGIPTFRDQATGLWARYDPAELATPYAFASNPKLVWEWYSHRRQLARAAAPNAGHLALAELARLHPHVTTITQNVDDLHERAGSPSVLHLHGDLFETRCSRSCQGYPTRITEFPAYLAPPPCPHCGAPLRPGVVWFGEAMPQHELGLAFRAADEADLCLVVGTSGMVQPAASVPLFTKRKGGLLIEVNPRAGELTAHADWWHEAPAGLALPPVLEAYRALRA